MQLLMINLSYEQTWSNIVNKLIIERINIIFLFFFIRNHNSVSNSAQNYHCSSNSSKTKWPEHLSFLSLFISPEEF